MAEVAKGNISNFLLSRDYPPPRLPSNISPEPSRRDSLRQAHLSGTLVLPPPTSPSSSLRQKRPASLSIDAAAEARVEDLALNSATSISTISTGDKVCLCQPDPKIPRPRNAFILYRQHYQAQVVALHPGLANPEISKIIGEQWTSQPAEVKNEWKRLAEEEKIRHQRQYPDYRYQPRRAGTTTHTRRISSGEGPIRCPKCNGRYILTPRTPGTPVTPGLRARDQNERLQTPLSSQDTSDRNMTIDDRAQFPAAPSNTSRTYQPHPQARWRPGPLQQNHDTAGLNSPRERRISVDVGASPDFKRRRFNDGSQGQIFASPYDSQQYRPSRPPLSATGYADGRRPHLPPAPLVQHPKVGMMEPPPRPSPAMHQFSNMSLNSPYDESLRLPPLQTQGNTFGPGQSHMNTHQRADSQARSVEAMVMTIPYINKIKVLAKISPPLAPPGPTSPTQNVRGPVIAVEGADHKLLAEVGNFLQEHLSKDPECLVKTWPTTVENTEKSSINEAGMASVTPLPSTNPSTSDSPYLAYLRTIQSWHSRSVAIKDFITGVPSSSQSDPSASATSPLVSPRTILTPILPSPNDTPLGTSSTSTTTAISTANPSKSPSSAKAGEISSTTTIAIPLPVSQPLPIALLPHGFSLSISDSFASTVPITDAYAPVDHWQWMSTLWRGIIGPDLTVYVRSLEGDNHQATLAGNGNGVEVRWDIGVVVVTVGGRVEETSLRRLKFEVEEWIRAFNGRNSRI